MNFGTAHFRILRISNRLDLTGAHKRTAALCFVLALTGVLAYSPSNGQAKEVTEYDPSGVGESIPTTHPIRP